jgi:hypothetical protein
MRGLRTDRTASVLIRGHYELGVEAPRKHLALATAFDELAEAI